jgi:hypothetical protein
MLYLLYFINLMRRLGLIQSIKIKVIEQEQDRIIVGCTNFSGTLSGRGYLTGSGAAAAPFKKIFIFSQFNTDYCFPTSCI